MTCHPEAIAKSIRSRIAGEAVKRLYAARLMGLSPAFCQAIYRGDGGTTFIDQVVGG